MYVVPTVSQGERRRNTAVAAFLELSECVIGAASKAIFCPCLNSKGLRRKQTPQPNKRREAAAQDDVFFSFPLKVV